mgnify:CR=1 FL=1
MFYVERMLVNHWVVVSGPWGCEQTAYIHAKQYQDGRRIRIINENGSVVNML